MIEGRFVLVGLARARRPWCNDVARWSTSGATPTEFVNCVSVDEVRAVIGSGRRISALVADAGVPRLDRELVHVVAATGASTIVVSDGRIQRDWESLGCAAVLQEGFDQDGLLEVLARHCRPVAHDLRTPTRVELVDQPTGSSLVAVLGDGGSGASNVAMCLAQVLAEHLDADSVALVDGARRGDLAMYHDVGDVIPGLPELVDAHRVDTVDPDEIRRLLFRIDERGYSLLLGLRRARDWVSLRPRSVAAALDGLSRAYPTVVIDIDPDLEGEDETGSIDVEDRHAVTRVAVARADLVVVVASTGIKGLHGLARLVQELCAAGVPAERILPVVNRSPRNAATRASETATITQLLGEHRTLSAVHLPSVARMERAHRQVAPFGDSLCRPLGRAVRTALLHGGARQRDDRPERPILPGSFGVEHPTIDGRSEVA